MTSANPSSTPALDPGTTSWQPETIAERQSAISDFLDGQFTIPAVREAAELTLRLLDLPPGGTVLDVGCGTGIILPLLARAVGPTGRVVGVDHSPEILVEARARADADDLSEVISFHEADACALPFDDDSFDGARCERVLIHLADPIAALREMARVVRPGGRIVVSEPDWGALAFDHPDPETFDPMFSQFITRFRQPRIGRSLYRRFADAGLTDREVHAIYTVLTETAILVQSGLDLGPVVDTMVSDGHLERERAAAAVNWIAEAEVSGRFFAAGPYFTVAGRVPARTIA